MTDCKNEGNGRLSVDIFLIVIVEGAAAGKVRASNRPLIALRGDDFSPSTNETKRDRLE